MVALAGALVAGACGGASPGESGEPAPPQPTATPTAVPTAPTTEPTPEPTPANDRVAAPNGLYLPELPDDEADLADLLGEVELTIRDPSAGPDELAEAGRIQQLIYRVWAVDPDLDELILDRVPDQVRPAVELNLAARRYFVSMPTGLPTADEVPAWQIVAPEPPGALLEYYLEAQAASGIGWEYLAAVHLVETGMGRIDGLSTAGAQGPMQFIPETWEWIGEGDVDDARDAILAAGRLLAVGGGPEDMTAALWAYNQSEHYGRAVTTYAEIMRADPRAFFGYYHWEIYFFTTRGDVWLPVGYRSDEAMPVDRYLAQAPSASTEAVPD